MSETRPYLGRFVWYELMTTDVPAAERFYSTVVGWKSEDFSRESFVYKIVKADVAEKQGVAGIMNVPNGAPFGPHFIGYIAVDDVDAYCKRVVALGGSVGKELTDIPDVGRLAGVLDPQGASFMLFTPTGTGDQPVDDTTPGHIGWRELVTSDWEKALGFYGELFGWKREGEAVDMGAMGKYQLFGSGPQQMGGMMTGPGMKPMWTYYISVASCAAAADRAKASGGKIVRGPHEVPGGGWIAHGVDPEGAPFAVTGPK